MTTFQTRFFLILKKMFIISIDKGAKWMRGDIINFLHFPDFILHDLNMIWTIWDHKFRFSQCYFVIIAFLPSWRYYNWWHIGHSISSGFSYRWLFSRRHSSKSFQCAAPSQSWSSFILHYIQWRPVKSHLVCLPSDMIITYPANNNRLSANLF